MNRPTLIKRICGKSKTFITELNLFPTYEDDDFNEIRNQILSSRIYLTLLILSVTGLFIYTSTVSITETIIIKQPLYYQYQNLISEKVSPQCQCKQSSITFNQFLHLQPQYHSICSSDFVSDQWIEFLSNLTRLSNLNLSDFRRTAIYSFQFLRSLCELAETTINETLQQQVQTKVYVSSYVKSEDVLQNEIQSYIDTLISTEEINFVHLFRIFSDMTYSQGLASTLSTNLIHYIDLNTSFSRDTTLVFHTGRVYYDKKSHTFCRCLLSKCYQEYTISDIDNLTLLFTISNFYTGCFIVDSLFQSRLTCFYNETCTKQLLFHLNSSLLGFTSISLNTSSIESSRINETIYELASHLMVKQWKRSIDFDKYYHSCEPIQCIYTYDRRFVLTYIIGTLSGLISGLVTVLRLFVPRIVQWIRNRKKVKGEKISIRHWLVGQVKSLNLFTSIPPSTEYEILRVQVISTYIYIVIFLMSLIFLIIYTAILPQTIIVTSPSPSIQRYEHLKNKYNNTLICECSQISIDLQTFIELTPKYHQICSSIFVTNTWYQYLTSFAQNPPPGTLFSPDDFRGSSGLNIFRTLELFCETSDETIQTKLRNLKSSTYVTKTVVEKLIFLEEQHRTIQLFKDDLHNSNGFSLKSSMNIIQYNGLYSKLQRSFYPLLWNNLSSVHMVYPHPTACLCFYYGEWCREEAAISIQLLHNDNIPSQHIWKVPGFFDGCYPFWSAIHSSLFCLYNESCLLDLMEHLQGTFQINISTLKEHSSSSIFNSSTSIDILFSESMVEQWDLNITYEHYYEKCQPKQCIYTYIKQLHISYMISTILGIIGGLSLSLRIIVPFLIESIRKIWIKLRNQGDEDDQDDNQASMFSTFNNFSFELDQ